MSDNASEALRGGALQKGPQNASHEVLWETVRERDERRSQQNQRGRYDHQEKMLRHVGRQEFMVQSPQRRRYSDPQ